MGQESPAQTQLPTDVHQPILKLKGLKVVRLPFRWERLQPSLMGPLDALELKRLDKVVGLARDRQLKILLDVHNYARYRNLTDVVNLLELVQITTVHCGPCVASCNGSMLVKAVSSLDGGPDPIDQRVVFTS